MEKQTSFRTLVSIVNYCSSDLVCRMLPSLIEQLDETQDKVVVVDNCSPDDSLKKLEEFVHDYELRDCVVIVTSDKNGGFSYGNNFALKVAIEKFQAEPDFVWLLNPDTLVQPGAFEALLDFLSSNSKVGIVGSRLEGENGTPQESAFNFYTVMSEFLYSMSLGFLKALFPKKSVSLGYIPSKPVKCDWLAGASMFIRYEAYEKAGLMDETYFLYFEETDLCMQIHKLGWECWYVPMSRVVHLVGQSTGVVSGDTQRRRRPKYWFESRQHFFLKNYGFLYTALTDFTWGVCYALLQVRYFFQGKKGVAPEKMLFDFWRNSIFFSWIK
jgi:hypothetical protein